MKTRCILMPKAGRGSVAFPRLCNPALCFPAGHRPGGGQKQKGGLLHGGGGAMARDALQGSAPPGPLSAAARKETAANPTAAFASWESLQK